MKRVLACIIIPALFVAYILVMLQTWPFLILLFISVVIYKLAKKNYFSRVNTGKNVKHLILLGIFTFLFAISVADLALRWKGGNIAWLDDDLTPFERLYLANYNLFSQFDC